MLLTKVRAMKDHIKSEKEQEMKISDTHDPKEEGAAMFGLDIVLGHASWATIKSYLVFTLVFSENLFKKELFTNLLIRLSPSFLESSR